MVGVHRILFALLLAGCAPAVTSDSDNRLASDDEEYSLWLSGGITAGIFLAGGLSAAAYSAYFSAAPLETAWFLNQPLSGAASIVDAEDLAIKLALQAQREELVASGGYTEAQFLEDKAFKAGEGVWEGAADELSGVAAELDVAEVEGLAETMVSALPFEALAEVEVSAIFLEAEAAVDILVPVAIEIGELGAVEIFDLFLLMFI